MTDPTSVSELRRFLGMANQLAKFIPDMAAITKPLRDLLSTRNAWSWEHPQQEAFAKVKEVLSTAPTLSLYDPCQETIVSADASSYRLGAVLLQKQKDGSLRPTVYASRALTPTEQRYAQIEKEALPLTWACERFQEYLLGMHFQLHTDHKPLVLLLGSKALDSLPMRVQRFRLRLMRFKYTISHVPGKNLAIADVLSRAPLSESNELVFAQEVEAYVHSIVDYLPISETRLKQILQSQEERRFAKELKIIAIMFGLPVIKWM